MPAQSSLKAKAGAILERTTQRTISAQSKKKPAQYPRIAQKISNSRYSDIEKIRAWLNQASGTEVGHHDVLDECRSNSEALSYYLERAMEYGRDKRRQKVLNMLAENPDKKRAYITNTETDSDNVILTIAIRGTATFEIPIPKIKYDPFLLMEIIDNGSLQ
jgi:hypothetical protein